jgi:predicted NBD/HSP70 family sugar kinase
MKRTTADTAEQLLDLRRANGARCAEVIRRGPATIAQIAQESSLSRPTVTARLQDLLDAGLALEVGVERHIGAGRPASRFVFAPHAATVAGLELAKHVERLIFTDLLGRTVWHGERPAPLLEADARLASAAEWVTATAVGLQEEFGPLARVCVTVPGAMDAAGAFVEAAAFSEWGTRPVPPIVQAAFDVPVDVAHDLAAAMFAERRMGAATDVQTFIVPVLWHRVSAGVVIGGQVYTGSHGRAGRPHMLPQFRQAEDDHVEWPSDPGVAELIRSAEGGDVAANASLDRFASLAAEQIAMLQLAIDPQLVVLHGPLVVFDSLVSRVRDRLIADVDHSVPLVISDFGLYGTVIGSALIALDNAGADLIGPGLSPLSLDRSRLSWATDGQRVLAGTR